MTDMELNKILSDAFPLTDTPDSLSEKAIRTKVESVTPVKAVSIPLGKTLAAAALFLIVLGIGFLNKNSLQASPKSPDTSSGAVTYNEAASEQPVPAPVPSAGGSAADVTEDESVFFEETQSENKPAFSDSFTGNVSQEADELYPSISLVINEECVYSVPAQFGNDYQICYYDEENESLQQEPCVSAVLEGDRLIMHGMIPGITIVEITEGSLIFRIKVTVLGG